MSHPYAQWEATVLVHARAHGCGCPRWDRGCENPAHADGHRYHGMAYCPEAQRLQALLPPEEIPPAWSSG